MEGAPALVTPILPDIDIWLKSFSRSTAEPLVVHDFSLHIQQRRIIMVGWIRQGLLARTTDDRQFRRLESALAAFPDLRVLTGDHLDAARLVRLLRDRGVTLGPWQALLWTLAQRIGGVVWSGEAHWKSLRHTGCPLL
jgi:hypothetical protein